MVVGDPTLTCASWSFALLLPWAVLVWWKRDLAAVFLLALLPTYLLRTTLLGVPTTWFELALYVVCAVYLLRGDLKTSTWREVPPSARYAGALWLVAATLGVLVAPDTRLALGIFKAWIVDPLLLMGVLSVVAVRVGNQSIFLRRSVGALLTGAAVTSVAALGTGYTVGWSRLSAWYDSPNVLAMYLVPVAAVTLLYLWRETVSHRAWWYLGALLVFVGIVSTGSYGAWLGLVAAVALGWLYTKPAWGKAAQWAAFGVVVLGLVLPWALLSLGRWPLPSHRNETYGVSSGQVRLVLWREATKFIVKHPVLGVGLGQWQPIFESQLRPYLPEKKQPGLAIELYYASLFPHNLWLTTWLFMGLLGVAALLYLCWYVYQAGTRSSTPAIVAVALLTAILVQGWFDTPGFKNDLSVLLWLPVLFTAVASQGEAKVH